MDAASSKTLGVMSDTHGNTSLMLAVAKEMQTRYGVQVIFHLGDDYEDAEWLGNMGYPVRKVPGLWCAAYHDGRIPKRLVEDFDGVLVACAHADKDLRYTERAAAIVLTGHTHQAAVDLLGRSLYVNPGHLARTTSRGEPATYAIIDLGPEQVHVQIRDVSGGVRAECTVPRDRLA